MKIQIIGGKIIENLGFGSNPRSGRSNFFVLFFSFHFQILHENCISLFLTIFEYLVLQIRYQ